MSRIDVAMDPFLRSALAADSAVLPLDAFFGWLEDQRARRSLAVRRVAFADLDQWRFGEVPLRLEHRSGKFFTIEGLRVESDFGPKTTWDQPIINQPEIGILGLIARDFGGIRHFLMQAKMEPGNINGIQMSPTVQATFSNYSQVHGGRRPSYNSYFTEPGHACVLVDRLLGEQGSRFLKKRNRNMIVEVTDDIAVEDGFCWLTLGQIKQLMRVPNLVNMTARSVLSCVPFARPAAASLPDHPRLSGFGRDLAASLQAGEAACHSDQDLLNWLTDLRARHQVRLERRPLDALAGWTLGEDELCHESGRHFSVIAVEVEAIGREVTRWSQPLLHHSGDGLNGFLLQRIDGVLHFLVRACMFPGNSQLFELGSTVSRANARAHFGAAEAPAFLEWFRAPPPAWVRFATVQSEEGGRFHHFENQYVMLEVPEEIDLDLPPSYRWMTLGQLNTFNQHGHVNIEGRNLLACLDFSDMAD